MDTKKIIKDSYPSSEKIYIPGKLFPIQVGMRKINLTDTVTVENGKRIHTPNAPVYVYDTVGLIRSRYYGRYRQRASTSARIMDYGARRCGATRRYHLGIRPCPS